MKIKDTEIKVIQGDITQLEVEAIVNAANNKLLMGGGVAGTIKRKGGKVIEDEALKKAPIAIGEAVATKAGLLKAKYVIHAATMGLDFKTDEIKIRNSCRSSLKAAAELGVKSIAFPALGCGTGGFSLLASAKIMAQEVLKYLREEKITFKEIIFCLYDEEALAIFKKGVLGYLEYVTTKLSQGPYLTVDAIIELPEGIVVIQRSNPPFGWALPGGFVDYGESLEDAVKREAKEETDLDLTEIKQFHTYSHPQRDPRFHTVGTVFIAQAKGKPKAGDDAAGISVVKFEDIRKLSFAFDHKQIIEDYLKERNVS
ncbi:MAG: macro domain-containing protein [Candidatus Omnitrophota bacterium]|jgi:O-acetyl-ADP-ribose deacetylase (regulator of RNase III)/ADP-ribose pyrophosphatase YjhB (NUDIX family)